MPIPYIPTCGFPVTSASSQDVLEKFANLGTQVGYNRTDRDTWVMKSPSEVHNIKVFYVPYDENHYTCYAVSNYRINNPHLWCVTYVSDSSLPYDFSSRFLVEQKPGIDGHNVYISNTLGATGNIILEKLNPTIPVFNTVEEGCIQADSEGWVYRDPDNPYEFDPDAISYAGGGTGKFDNASDSIGVPSLPTLSAVSAGFVSMYSPTLNQLNQLASFLWTDNLFDPDNFKKLFTDPMECIIGLTIVPVDPPSAGSMSVKVGYIDTGISMARLSTQYAEVNCGTLQANEFWGSALDYSPFTKIHIYLPYVGMREVNADDIMGKSVGVVYHIDLLSGACTAFVTAGGSVLYQFNGQCSINIPLAASNFTEMIHSAISAIGSVAMTASGAGAASSAVGAAAVGTAASMGAAAANSAIGSKPTFSHSGQMGGSGGMLAVQTPYIIIERPRQCVADDVNKFVGFPSNITYRLYDLEGYTVVDNIHLDGFSCTDNEAAEILSLLKGGVIL